jgi:hypothetical protein
MDMLLEGHACMPERSEKTASAKQKLCICNAHDMTPTTCLESASPRPRSPNSEMSSSSRQERAKKYQIEAAACAHRKETEKASPTKEKNTRHHQQSQAQF